MVRIDVDTGGGQLGIPHARGDGPPDARRSRHPCKYSPRPWGWSGLRCWRRSPGTVFPTPVGMARRSPLPVFPPPRFPHARGDGPLPRLGGADLSTYSPRPWGWSADPGNQRHLCRVFPTPVGMARSPICVGRVSRCIPHARGDGPSSLPSMICPTRYSPRPWGWSAPGAAPSPPCHVFPTPVGMARPRAATREHDVCIPHARGDGPFAMSAAYSVTLYSPRPWGWPAGERVGARAFIVFPTPVGMARRRWDVRRIGSCIPHARGDGPRFHAGQVQAGRYSPRPWGWPDYRGLPG